MEDAADLSKMKVADLKKELKARGLPLSGNKNELVERLQEALATGDGSSLPLTTTEGEEEDFDEEEILAGEEDMDADLGKLTPQEEEAALQGTIRESALLEPEKKKISLKRSEPTLPAQENGQEVADSNDKENTETSPPPKKIVKINAPPSDTPVASNLDARAQRFGITPSETTKKQARADRFGGGNARRPAKLSSETGDIDVSKLKARAERFGEVTSKILTQEASNDQIKKRQERFGVVSSTSETKTTTESSDAKAARAARFGMSGTTTGSDTAAATPATGTAAAAATTATATAAAAPEEEEMKKKRAERFASK